MRVALLPTFLLTLLALAACSSPGTIGYTPPFNLVAGPPAALAAVAVEDVRDEKPNRIATVRGGYGNPAYVMDTPAPVGALVQTAFLNALAARNITVAAGANRHLRIVLRTLYGDQYLGRKAVIDLDVQVLNTANALTYEDSVKDTTYVFNAGFGGIHRLRDDVQILLSKAIDTILDRPAFRTAITSPAP